MTKLLYKIFISNNYMYKFIVLTTYSMWLKQCAYIDGCQSTPSLLPQSLTYKFLKSDGRKRFDLGKCLNNASSIELQSLTTKFHVSSCASSFHMICSIYNRTRYICSGPSANALLDDVHLKRNRG